MTKFRSILLTILLILLLPIVQAEWFEEKSVGSDDATVTIVWYNDLQDPFGARWFENSFGLIADNFIDAGDVKLIYKHFPLDFHNRAIDAAIGAECAAEQLKLWEYIKEIYDNDQQISNGNLIDYADNIGLDMDEYNSCLVDYTLDKVIEDRELGKELGISGTPTFFINDEKLVGAQPYAVFEELIVKHIDGDYVEPEPIEQIEPIVDERDEDDLGETPKVRVWMGRVDNPYYSLSEEFWVHVIPGLTPTDYCIYDVTAPSGFGMSVRFECDEWKTSVNSLIADNPDKWGVVLGEWNVEVTVYYERNLPTSGKTTFTIVEENICDDSDGGKDYYIRGQTTDSGITRIDDCGRDNKVQEYYCTSSNRVEHELYPCPSGCKDGACIGGESNIDKCTDSDGGREFYVRGKVSAPRGIATDTCFTDKIIDYKLIEWECKESGIRPFYYDCPNGCNDGACIGNDESGNQEKPIIRPIPRPVPPRTTCKDDDSRPYICPDNLKVDWCECLSGRWECINNPQFLCPTSDEEEELECSTGCEVDDLCIPFGQRLVLEGANFYCDFEEGDITVQKIVGESCQNNYECETNQCSSGTCIDLQKELEETRGIMQKILDFLKRIFG